VGVYSGAEIFEIAMELEEAGRVFYETLAEEAEDHDLVDLCRNLAAQESNHYRRFKNMSAELVQRPASRPLTWDELHFAQMLIEERVLSDPDAAQEAARSGDLAGTLETAIRLEKDSVGNDGQEVRRGAGAVGICGTLLRYSVFEWQSWESN